MDFNVLSAECAPWVYISIIYRPQPVKVNKWLEMFYVKSQEELEEEQIEYIEAITELSGAVMAALFRYEPEMLGCYEHNGVMFSEAAEFIGYLVNGEWQRVPLPRSEIKDMLTTSRPFFGKGGLMSLKTHIVIPNLLNWPESIVVLDIKQENWDITSGFRKKHGQECFLFNPAATDYRDEHKVYVTGFADVLVRKEIAVSMTVDKNGVQNTTFSGQTDVGSIGGANLFAGASGTLNNEGNLTSGSAWINPVGPAYDAGVAKIIPVGQVEVKATTTGDFGLKNIRGTIGVVINPDGTKANVVGLIGGAIGGESLNLTANYSHDIPLNNGVIVTPNVGVTQDVLKGNTSVSGGVRAHDPHLFGKTTGGALEVTASGTSLQNNPDYAVNAKVSMTFGNAPATNNSVTPLEAAFIKAAGKTEENTEKDATPSSAARHGYVSTAQHQAAAEQEKAPAGASNATPNIITTRIGDHNRTTVQPHEQPNTVDAQNKQNLLNEYNAMSDKQRDVFVTRMAEVYQGSHAGADLRGIKDQIAHNIVSKQDTLNIAPEVVAQH